MLVTSRRTPQRGFAHRPYALRRRIIVVLERIGPSLAAEIAANAYAGRINQSHPASCTAVQIATVRKALRRMIDNGNVVAAGHHRGRRVYRLSRQTEFPPLAVELELDG